MFRKQRHGSCARCPTNTRSSMIPSRERPTGTRTPVFFSGACQLKQSVATTSPCSMYGEDVELSYRLREAGYLLRYCPAAAVFHYSYDFELQIKPLPPVAPLPISTCACDTVAGSISSQCPVAGPSPSWRQRGLPRLQACSPRKFVSASCAVHLSCSRVGARTPRISRFVDGTMTWFVKERFSRREESPR